MATLSVTEWFELLENGRRQQVLAHLQAEPEAEVGELARQVAASEAGLQVDDVPDDLVQDVRVMLHHLHLPLLTESDVLAVEDETVRRGPNFVIASTYLKFVADDPDPVRIDPME